MIKLQGIKKTIRAFKKIEKNLNDPSKVMKTIAQMGVKDVDAHFRNESGPNGKWETLDKDRSRKRDKGGDLILNDSGTLKRSIRGSVQKKAAVVSTNIKYADFHQHQNKKYSRPPQRKFLWISDKASKLMAKILGKFIVKV